MMINHAVIHELVKAQHEDIKPSNIRGSVLDKDDGAVQKLVSDVIEVYGKKNNTAHYGVFKEGEGRGTFPDKFIAYSSELLGDGIFLELSKEAMKALYSAASNASAASGGYILFVDYTSNSVRYFLIAMIKQKPGITLNNLTPKELEGLDLNRLNQAARINFSKFLEYQSLSGKGKDELSYLSFVSPHSHTSASGYFISAIGCSHGTASSTATRTLITQAPKFFRNNPILKKNEGEFKISLEQYLAEKAHSGESVKLSELGSLFRKHIPLLDDDEAEALSNQFISYLNAEEQGIPPEFPVHSATLNRLTSIKYKSNNWRIQFDRSALGAGEDAEIFYDTRLNRLVIKDIDGELAELIKDELGSRSQDDAPQS